MVAPELANSGWNFNSRQEAYEQLKPYPEENRFAWMKKAAEQDIYIVGGICEKEGVDLLIVLYWWDRMV